MSKRQEMREKRDRQQKKQRNLLIIAGVAVIAIAVVLILVLPNLQPATPINELALKARPQVKFNGTGDPNAPVKIIEYSDFQCPYCQRFVKETEQQLIDTYVATGKVYFEYHSFANFIGDESARAAEAAYCAGDQNKFWEMHDILFANQGAENSGALSDNHLVTFANKIGLDMNQFNTCFNNGKYANMVSQDGTAATQAGVKATPSFVVNGQLLEGAQPFSVFQSTIDALLKK